MTAEVPVRADAQKPGRPPEQQCYDAYLDASVNDPELYAAGWRTVMFGYRRGRQERDEEVAKYREALEDICRRLDVYEAYDTIPRWERVAEDMAGSARAALAEGASWSD